MKVLIVDDNPLNLDLLHALLEGQGWLVEEARHGAEALTRAHQAPPQLIISDLLMPVMDGYTLLRHWKDDNRLKAIPFIVYTATYTDPKDEQLALDFGADAFILKPAESRVFIERIKKVLAESEGQTRSLARTPQGPEAARLRNYGEVIVHQLEHQALQLKEERNLLRTLVDSLPVAAYVKDPAGRKTLANLLHARNLGLASPSEALGKTDFDFFPREQAQRSTADDQQVLRTGQPVINREESLTRPDGATAWLLTSKVPLRDAAGHITGLVGVALDITEKKKLEAQFLRAQRMENIGTLAGGIAHDLNNILAPIVMAASLLPEQEMSSELPKLASLIQTNAQRGADIVKQLITFARGASSDRTLLQPRHLIREILKLTGETFPKSIHLQTELPPDLWPILGDATQFHQMLLNLCVNARDAMPDGGTLTIAAANVTLDAAQASQLPGAKPGPHFLLEVSDTGVGIPPAILDRIFDPFFTTKALGKGTGLGLSTVLGIVRSHHGSIHVLSEPAKGASFKIYLPAQPDAEADPAPFARPAIPGGHGETVLVVDDEASIREATRNLLARHNYQPLLAADGAEALALFARHKDQVKLVLTDLMMPVMDGLALVHELLKASPGLLIIVSTGVTEGDEQVERIEQLKGLGITRLLLKPYTLDKLLDALRDALAAPPVETPADA